MLVQTDGWLKSDTDGEQVILVPSVRSTYLEAKGIQGIVWHWVGGPGLRPEYPKNLADSIRTYNPGSDAAASWHILIAKDGRVFQSVQLTRGAWHVGKPGRIGAKPVKMGGVWNPLTWPGTLMSNINHATCGIELENAGELKKIGEKFYCWPYWADPHNESSGADHRWEIPAERVVLSGDAIYDGYTNAQKTSAAAVTRALIIKFALSRDVCQYGHFHFDSPRKQDPGPVWMDSELPEVLNAVFGVEAAS